MPGSECPCLRQELRFWGWVQGVGFRYRAQWAARGLGLTGWVQNLPDESVLMEIQGPESAIDQMLWQLEAGPYIRIENISVRSLPLNAQEYGFEIRA